MKTPLVLTVLVLVAGCGDNSNNPASQTNAAGDSVVTAPVDYLNAIGKAQQHAVKTVDTTAINQAIQMFQVDKGRYPKDLNELVQEKFLPQVPTPPYGTKLVYDADAGQVKVVKE